MSGIFGFTYRNADDTVLADAIGGLSYWNRIYGREASDGQVFDTSGIGCHVEHFSDHFPYSRPILDHAGCPAVVDALLYNRDELIAELHDDTLSRLPDEELLLKFVDEQGFDALARVNGDFTGAIFHPETREWTLFRDHLGVRPLYIYLDNDHFAFSTDMRGLLALPGVDTAINEMRLFQDINHLNYLSLQKTEFARITCLRPACVTHVRMVDTSFTYTESVYWRIRQKKIRFRTEEEYRREMYRLVEDSVNRRCDAISGTLGAELSGGLDSSVIDILISRHGRKPVCYSWSLDPCELPLKEGLDERKVVMDICAQENLEYRFRTIADTRSFSSRREWLTPPNIDTVTMSYGAAWLNSRGAKVVFTGHGGDEGISHRGKRFELFYNREYLAYFKLYWQDAAGKKLRPLRALKWGVQDAWTSWREVNRKPNDRDLNCSILNSHFTTRMCREYVHRRMFFNFAPHEYVMQGGTRPRMDNAAYQGAFNGVRYLFPYVDYRVMDFAVSIPRRLYLSQKHNRVIFRETFRDIMPQSLADVTYKYSPSTRGQTYSKGYENRFQNRLDHLIAQLDRERWEPYFNFDAIRNLTPSVKPHTHEAGMLAALMGNLSRYIMIQNLQQEAPNWREFDERDKETV